jgi:hypothetical protein
MAMELADSLRSFYIMAHVGDFMKENHRYYSRALFHSLTPAKVDELVASNAK